MYAAISEFVYKLPAAKLFTTNLFWQTVCGIIAASSEFVCILIYCKLCAATLRQSYRKVVKWAAQKYYNIRKIINKL